MPQPAWLDRVFRSGPNLTLPRRFLVPYLTTLSGDQVKVLFAVYCQWMLSEHPTSFRVRRQEIGAVCDLPISLVHRALGDGPAVIAAELLGSDGRRSDPSALAFCWMISPSATSTSAMSGVTSKQYRSGPPGVALPYW